MAMTVLASAVLLAAMPAQARSVSARTSTEVDVLLDLSAAEPIAAVPYEACPVSVPEGADGIDVLGAARDSGCIDSFETTDYGFGKFVDCIDGICGTAATYWRMTENGVYTTYGVSDFEAQDGDVLGFSYTQWATCLADPGLC